MKDESKNPEKNEAPNTRPELIHALISYWNLDLLRDANEDLQEVDSYVISVTAFHIGVVTLSAWSLLIFLSYIINKITLANSLLGSATTVVQLGPIFPIFLFLFAYISKWSFRRLQETSPPESEWNLWIRMLALGVASGVSLVVAGIGRWGMFLTFNETYGATLNSTQFAAIIIIDIGYLSLLMIGLGGIGCLIFEPIPKDG